MDDQPHAGLALRDFDEMIAAAQRAEAEGRAALVHMAGAGEGVELEAAGAFVGFAPHAEAAGDVLADEGVELVEIEAFLRGEAHGLHAAADVHAHEVGADAAFDRHGEAHHTALARVAVGHDADTAPGSEGLVAECAYLPEGGRFQLCGEDPRRGVGARDFDGRGADGEGGGRISEGRGVFVHASFLSFRRNIA